MKIRGVAANNRRRVFEVETARDVWVFPYGKAQPPLALEDKVADVYADPELGREAFTYELVGGGSGSIHIDAVLEYNEDPTYMADVVAHELTAAVHAHLEQSTLSRREIMRRLGTSPSQLYRLLDADNTTKSLHQVVALLHVLGCQVSFQVTKRPA